MAVEKWQLGISQWVCTGHLVPKLIYIMQLNFSVSAVVVSQESFKRSPALVFDCLSYERFSSWLQR